MSEQDEKLTRQFCLSALHVSDQDITTLGAALGSCDEQLLLAALLDGELNWCVHDEVMDSRCAHMLVRRVSSALDVIRELCAYDCENELGSARMQAEFSPHKVEREQKSGMIVPFERLEAVDGRGRLNRCLGAALLDLRRDDIAYVYEHISDDAACATSCAEVQNLRAYLCERPETLRWRWHALNRSLDVLKSLSWAQACKMLIWLPASLSPYERYSVLARVFWEITYFGIDNASSEIRWGERLSQEAFIGADDEGSNAAAGPPAQTDSTSATTDITDDEFFCAQDAFYDERYRADDGLANKMMRLVKAFNYHSWVDLVVAAHALSRLDAVA